jgi:predicted aminopeptidase
MATGGLLCAGALVLAALCAGSGCSSVGYLTQAAGGHVDLMWRARPVAEALADPATPATLRDRLAASQRLRDFAASELKLPDNPSYRRYADLPREAVVWNVVAAPPLSLTLKTWCFPVMGCVGYRGYFNKAEAEAEAAELRAAGFETTVYGVPAYSTLGWTNVFGGDPLLSTFIGWSEVELARLIFHELAHQALYVADDTAFNESFATAVERIGSRRWLDRFGSAAQHEEAATADERREAFRALTLRWRAALDRAYVDPGDDTAKRAAKAKLMAAMRADYAALKAGPWHGFAGYDGWFERANNASLAMMAAYNELVPDFERLFDAGGGDFLQFYAAVRELAPLPPQQRRARLSGAR